MTNMQLERISNGVQDMKQGEEKLLAEIFGREEWKLLTKKEKLTMGKEFHLIALKKYKLQSRKKSDNHWLYSKA